MLTIKLMVFVCLTGMLLWVSRKPLREPGSHGFYRTFAWEAILILILLNLDVWFYRPTTPTQIISWVLLFASILPAYQGYRLLRRVGSPDPKREDPALIGLEKTTTMISEGLYAYIRHPLYASLLCLAWGVFFKRVSWVGICLAAVATVFIITTARIEEEENIVYFGDAYREYMKRTKMFIPFIY